MLSKGELYQIGFGIVGGAGGMLIVGLLLPGELGWVLRNAALLGLPAALCFLGAGGLLRR
jgi:hypothetical protein